MRIGKNVLAACLVSLASLGSGGAAELAFTGMLGGPLEGGDVYIRLRGTVSALLLCPRAAPMVEAVAGQIHLSARTASPDDVVAGKACEPIAFSAGRLAARTYRVTARIASGDGASGQTIADTLRVLPAGGGRCDVIR